MAARNISLRMDNENIVRIDRLASTVGRSRAWVLNQAAERYLDYEEWFLAQVNQGLDEARTAELVSHQEVMDEIRSKINGSLAEK
jgi:predicted transcriptional regulator